MRRNEKKIKEFMWVLGPIQYRLQQKYGDKCMSKWREIRLKRANWEEL